MAVSEARRRSNDRWDAENTKRINIKLMKERDAEILEYWAKLEGKTEVFRELMLDYMKKHPINDES